MGKVDFLRKINKNDLQENYFYYVFFTFLFLQKQVSFSSKMVNYLKESISMIQGMARVSD